MAIEGGRVLLLFHLACLTDCTSSCLLVRQSVRPAACMSDKVCVQLLACQTDCTSSCLLVRQSVRQLWCCFSCLLVRRNEDQLLTGCTELQAWICLCMVLEQWGRPKRDVHLILSKNRGYGLNLQPDMWQ